MLFDRMLCLGMCERTRAGDMIRGTLGRPKGRQGRQRPVGIIPASLCQEIFSYSLSLSPHTHTHNLTVLNPTVDFGGLRKQRVRLHFDEFIGIYV